MFWKHGVDYFKTSKMKESWSPILLTIFVRNGQHTMHVQAVFRRYLQNAKMMIFGFSVKKSI